MFAGSLVALATPMIGGNTVDAAVDWAGLEKLIDWHLESGTHGIVAVGTTGESATLAVDEHLEVIRQTVARVSGRVPVIAGTGANSTLEAIELTSAAKGAGADACLLVAPYYNKPTQQGMYLHYKTIAAAVDIPQILYNVPGRTVADMDNDTVERLAGIDNIVGLKDATGDIPRGKALIEAVGDQLVVWSGDDATALELIKCGAKGDISVTANIAPAQMAAMCNAALAGDMAEAERINAQLDPLHQGLFVEANPIPVKWALHEMGLMSEAIRLPLTPLDERFRADLKQALKTAELL